jgi:N-acyl homoserine lactone hydrolase
MVMGCYLVEMSDGRRVLIDTGYPPDLPRPPAMGDALDETTVLTHLDRLGLGPADIDVLICTHFDVDHVGFHERFTRAELVVQRAHYELAKSGYLRLAMAQQHWDDPSLRYQLIDGDAEVLPGLTCLATSGHVLGHQSVLVRLPKTGPVLLAIDAVILGRLFKPDRVKSPADDDEEQLRASTTKLLDVVEREGVALTIFGHDGDQWDCLKKAPDFYD